MMDEVENVTLEVTPDVTVYSSKKDCELSWTFTLSCRVRIHLYIYFVKENT